ncbi:WD40 repeat domain-containing protein [Embleya sp. NBC_00888]|uniref:NACHT and WD repeat domain-containing protein n=1 Tax=Embleya sp. NBC_00888 TaxID=2975960 RepID=UPI00386F9D72|nr:WD40 repeat domain-containing protein [Embleya sp. NBC_00888]
MNELPPQRPMSPSPKDCEDPFAFGAALKRLRARSGISLRKLQQACAEVHPVSHSTIEHWGKGGVVSAANEPAFLLVLRTLGVTEQIDLDAWLKAARNLRSWRQRPTIAEPYRGLKSYNAAYAEVFHGRAPLVERVLGELDELRAQGGALLLTGASGTGKSSLLNAGVVPALGAGRLEGSAGWPVLSVNSESSEPDPLNDLGNAVASHVKADPAEVIGKLLGGPDAVEALMKRVVAAERATLPAAESSPNTETRIVVIVDQFERAMVSAEDGPGSNETFETFIAVLRAMTSVPAGVVVILSVRLDFLDALMQRDSVRALTRRRPPVFVEPMDKADLARVVEQPARAFKVDPEPGFVELVLGDISARGGRFAHQAGILPLLSHALQMTWQRGGGKKMTMANYLESGGVEGALRSTAEKIYADLSASEQAIARRMFFSLVHVQPSGTATRRRISQDELFDEVDCGEAELDAVLDRFVERRLLIIDEVTVEITHEALMVAWPELRMWLDADRGARLVAQQVTADARAWDQAKRPGSDLYSATRLQAARAWRTNYPADTNELSRAFIDASVKRSQRRTQQVWATLMVLILLAAGAGTLSGIVLYQARDLKQQRSDLKQQRDDAQSRTLASQASILRGKDVSLARQLALTAFRISPTTEARSALIEATALRPAVRMLAPGNGGIMYAVGIHPGGVIAAAAAENTVRLWDVSIPGHPKPRADLPGATCGKIYALAFSPSGNLLVVSCGDGSIHLWDTHDPMAPTALPPMTGLGAKVYSVTFNADGTMMAAAIAEAKVNDVTAGSARLWAVTGTSTRPLGEATRVNDKSPAKSVAFRPGDRQLAVGSDDGTVQIWDIGDPSRPTAPVMAAGATKAIGQLAFSPDGTLLAAGGADNLVHLWSTTDPRNPTPSGPPIGGSSTYINAVAFSPDGTTLAIAGSDSNNGIRLVNLDSRRVTATMPHPSPVTSVKFSPDGDSVISGANDGAARIWPISSPTLEGMDYTVSAARFSPDGNTLALGSADLQLLDVADPQHPRPRGPAVSNPDAFSGTLAFAPNNRLLAEGHGKSGSVQLWNISDPARMTALGQPLKAHSLQVETLAFSPDSTVLATGSRDGAVHLWDVHAPQTPVALSTPGTFGGAVSEVGFGPDGRTLVAAGADKTVRLWDIGNPKAPRLLGAPLAPANHYVYAAVFSPDGTLLAVGLADGTVRLYDITDPTHPKPFGNSLTGPEGYVFSVAFTTDGTALAATAGDGSVWMWNLHGHDAPTLYATLRMGTGAMYPINYQPHKRLLVAGGDQKKGWIWTTDTDTAIALVCATTGDLLTPKEWAKYLPPDRAYDPPCR